MAFRVFALWLLFTFLTGSAVAYGRALPDTNDLPSLGFNKCDNSPCFMSIDLKEYNLDSLREKLVHLPNSSIDPESQWFHLITSNSITYLVEAHSDVLVVEPLKPDTRFNLGRFIQNYGEPCGMITTDPIPTAALIYPNMMVYIAFSGQQLQERLNYSTPIRRVEIAHPVDNSYLLSCNNIKWLGFASMDFYWDRGLMWPGD